MRADADGWEPRVDALLSELEHVLKSPELALAWVREV